MSAVFQTLAWFAHVTKFWRLLLFDAGNYTAIIGEVTKSHAKGDNDIEYLLGWFWIMAAIKMKLPNSMPF